MEYKNFPSELVLLIGPANSGKTSFFLNAHPNGKIITTVEPHNLGVEGISNKNCINLKNINVNNDAQNFVEILDKFINNCSHLLIDESHFFDQKIYFLLKKLNFEQKSLYITLLTGTWNNKKFFFDETKHEGKKTCLIEFLDVFYFRCTPQLPKVFLFQLTCSLCKTKLTFGSSKSDSLSHDTVKRVDKKNFFPCCNDCKKDVTDKMHVPFLFSEARDDDESYVDMSVVTNNEENPKHVKISNFFNFLYQMHLYDSFAILNANRVF